MMRSIYFAVSLFILAAGITFSVQAGEIRADSSITAVTVYPGSAKVMRTSRLDLKEGINEVVIDDLPIGIIETSLRVDGEGEGDIRLGSVQLQRNILRDVVQEKEKALREQIEKVELERRVISDTIQRQQSQLEYIRQMVMGGNTAHGGKDEADSDGGYASLPLEQWQQAWQTLESATADVQRTIRESETALRDVDRTLSKLRRELNQVATNQKETRSAILQVESSTATELILNLTYQIDGARWEPVYDADLETAKGEIRLKTLAQISQRTGEDWTDVAVTLSTLRPSADSQLPQLDSWVLDFMPERPPMPAPMEEAGAFYRGDIAMDAEDAMLARAPALSRESGAKKRMVQQQSRLIATDFSAEYVVPGLVSLESGSDRRRFALSSQTLAAKVNLASAPRFDPRVMILAETSHTLETPLIGGTVSLYRDGSFVGNSDLQEKRSGEEIRLSFGEDSKVKIKFLPDPAQKRQDGLLFGKKKVVERHYKVSVKSNHDKPYAISIYDVLPVAAHEDIAVKRLGDTPTILDVDDKKGVVGWERTLLPQTKLDLVYGYSVSYPEEKSIPGL